MSDRPGRLRTLSTEPGCRIDACEHGLLHLNLGSLTLRLSRTELARLRRALDAADAACAPVAREAPLH